MSGKIKQKMKIHSCKITKKNENVLSWDKYSHAHKYQHECMAYPFYHSMLIEIHIFSSFGAVYDVVVDTFPRHFIFLIFLLLLLFFLYVWKNRSNIHLCRIFSSHASLIFFSFFVCISHHRRAEKNEKHVKIDRKGGANQIKYSKKWKGKCFSFLFFIVFLQFSSFANFSWFFLVLNLTQFED